MCIARYRAVSHDVRPHGAPPGAILRQSVTWNGRWAQNRRPRLSRLPAVLCVRFLLPVIPRFSYTMFREVRMTRQIRPDSLGATGLLITKESEMKLWQEMLVALLIVLVWAAGASGYIH